MAGTNTPATHDQQTPSPSGALSPVAPLATTQSFQQQPVTVDQTHATGDSNSANNGESTTNGRKEPARVQMDAQGRTLNPRSCVTCRKRKVKCDKIDPCSNCTRAHIECVFPAPGRAPRKVRKVGEGRDKELLDRLRRLEGVVKGLGVEVPEKEGEDHLSQGKRDVEQADSINDHGQLDGEEHLAAEKRLPQTFHDVEQSDRAKWVEEQREGRFEHRFGRLVINEGKSRYINSSFWANLSNEVEDLKGILNQSSDEDDYVTSPTSTLNPHTISHTQGWIFNFNSQSVDMLSLHPPAGDIRCCWEIYKDRVDPLVKVLHMPTLEPTVLQAASHLSNLSRGFEALLFTIYYGAVTSLSAEECLAKFEEEKPVLLARYRFAVEQALTRANVLTTEETIVLQAFVIFLICLRRNNDARVIWTLTGLVVRIAQTLGVHRDGLHFNLPPFEIEMRRRLWWQICILDVRASEDHGCDPTIVEQSFDTKMPLNINDIDMSPGMKAFPTERQGCTDMSFCLIRYEVANTFRRISYMPPGLPTNGSESYGNVTLEDKEKWITECHARLEERYLKNCDMNVPLFWVTATVARLMMSKMWLMAYHPFQRQDGGTSLPNETKEKLFITSLENIEYSILLDTEARTMKWGWLFKTYIQWHALAFILTELCHRATGDLVERAWRAVERSKDGRWGNQFTDDSRAHHLWQPIKKLYRKAQEARQRGLQEESMAKPGQLAPQRTYSPNPNPMFQHPPRPQITRAPLSQAQLQRFAAGPSFGEMPVDKHELFRSPKLPESTGNEEVDPMDAISLQNSVMPPQTNGYNFLNGTTNIQDVHLYNYNWLNGMPSYYPQYPEPNMPPPGFAKTISNDAIGYDAGTLPAMDTDADVNWESWDQLVQQFGMDVDSVPGAWSGM